MLFTFFPHMPVRYFAMSPISLEMLAAFSLLIFVTIYFSRAIRFRFFTPGLFAPHYFLCLRQSAFIVSAPLLIFFFFFAIGFSSLMFTRLSFDYGRQHFLATPARLPDSFFFQDAAFSQLDFQPWGLHAAAMPLALSFLHADFICYLHLHTMNMLPLLFACHFMRCSDDTADGPFRDTLMPYCHMISRWCRHWQSWYWWH